MDPSPKLRVTEWQPNAEWPQWDYRLRFVDELKGLVWTPVDAPGPPDLGVGLRHRGAEVVDRGWNTSERFWAHTVDRLRAELSPG